MEDTLIQIGSLREDQWKEYRDIWLEALQKAPEVFTASHYEQSKVSDDVWKERFESTLKERDGIVIFALVDNKPVGMIGAYFDDNPKFHHIATIWGAYVKPDYRNRGVATKMANALLHRLEEIKRITKIKTYSITNSKLAVNVYKHFGFDIVGIAKQELKIGNQYFDVYIMEKYF